MTDVILESIRAAVLLVIVVFLIRQDTGRSAAARRGWSLIVGGFGLLLFASLLDVTDNFESLNHLVVVGDTVVEAFLEKFVGFLGGFVAIAVGLMLWLPSLQRLDSEISGRKQAKAELRKITDLFKAILDHSPAQIYLKDAGGRHILVSREVERLYGGPEDSVVGKTARDLFPKESADVHVAHDREVLETRRAITKEYLIPGADGTRTFLAIKFPIFDDDGEVNRIGAITTDITERKRAEDALSKSEEQVRLLLNSTAEAIYGIDLEGNCTFANPACVRMLGYDGVEELLGQHMHDLIHHTRPDGSPYPAEECRIYQAFREGAGTHVDDEVLWRKDGASFAAEYRSYPVRRDGRITGSVVTFLDISERKRTEEWLIQAQRMEAIGQLTGGVAHDFNNLLGVVIGNVELLAEKIGNDETHVRSILRAALRGADLTERLLFFSRQHPLASETFEAGALIEEMTEMLRRTLGETIELKMAVATDLWAVTADPGQLENALLNLAINARDAMPEGGKLTIEAANATLDEAYVADHIGAPRGDYVVLAVSDNGIGMSPEALEHAFEPFFTTKKVGEGSGLGLSMVYGFVKQSGGHIMIYSEDGHGTVVKLYLPRAAADAEQAQGAADDETPGGHGETILLVEDDAALRELATSMLTGLGYEVTSAANGKTALAVLAASPEIDLLLSDVVLPGGMSGFELAREAVARRGDLKVLFMSGYAENAVRHNGALEPSHEVMSKPFRRQEMAVKLRALLDG